MNKLETEAHDALVAYEAQRRHARRFPPAPRSLPAGVWSPRLTEQQQREHEQYIRDNDLPF